MFGYTHADSDFLSESQMYEAMKTLNRKLDEILGRQERTLSMIGSVGAGVGHPAGTPGGAQGGMPPPQYALPIQRHEVIVVS